MQKLSQNHKSKKNRKKKKKKKEKEKEEEKEMWENLPAQRARRYSSDGSLNQWRPAKWKKDQNKKIKYLSRKLQKLSS